MAQAHSGTTRTCDHPHHPHAADTHASPQLRVFTLATQAAKQASLLKVMLGTYEALEKMIRHERASDAESLAVRREGLCSLMRSLNGEMARQLDGLVSTTGTLQAFATDEIQRGG